ncbi:MAG: transglycosylase SLT domain-containing protein [Cyclobacteriaceae bacterium]|nr:transglycosylase SLT domain-containing protein [Cyclobacteriaceae bacterium]MCH8516093.1 transglycosylase SLT domain-containing protein [Cyclobacteriaceae bacterium]
MKAIFSKYIQQAYLILLGLFFLPFLSYSQSFEEDTIFVSPITYDYVPSASYELIEERLACLQTEIPLNFNKTVKSFIEYFTVRNRTYTQLMVERSYIYFPLFEKYLAEFGLPDELKYLAIVESGLNPKAISPAGAGGLWQFMPLTGSSFQLGKTDLLDDRFNPEKATIAACKYLKQLYNSLGDWELALAAYNAGPGNVRKAKRRSGYKNSFWEIYDYLPRETRSYVPQFVAIIYALNYMEEHNFTPTKVVTQAAAVPIEVNRSIHLPTLAIQLNACKDEIAAINPDVLTQLIFPKDDTSYQVLIPASKLDYFLQNEKVILDSAENNASRMVEELKNRPHGTFGKQQVHYVVKSGDVLGTIAANHEVKVSDIRHWNNLVGNQIRVGQRLLLYLDEGFNYTGPKAVANTDKGSRPAAASPLNSKVYVVQPGDSLWKISQKYDGLTIDKIKQLNNLTDTKLQVGQRLQIDG